MRIGPLSPYTLEAEVAALRPREEQSRDVAGVVAEILGDVRIRGDEAVLEATRRLDWPGATAVMRVADAELEEAYHGLDPAVTGALETAIDNLTWFHRHELRRDWEETAPSGQVLGTRFRPVARAGLYVPGGLGAYASSVVMNAVPAKVAGVPEVFVCTPPDREGGLAPAVLAAAHMLGIGEVYRVGGAQAIGAMAYGTRTMPKADVISGPGNAYVNEAKRQVYGSVGIDGLAGPSEVLVVADEAAKPQWIAADLLAQAEHGSGAVAVLLASSEELVRAVEEAVEGLLRETGSRGVDPAGASGPAGALERPVSTGGEALVAYYPAAGADFRALALELIEAYAPEHLELHVIDDRGLLDGVRSAGAVFIGAGTPTAFGDYVAGTNHVLPTGGAARFSSPLSVDVFLRKSWTVELSPEAAAALAPPTQILAEREGFPFHGRSAGMRAR